MTTARQTRGPASENLQGGKPREGIRGRFVTRYGDYMSGGTVKHDFWALSISCILLFDLKSPFFRPDPGVCGARRARSVKDGAIAPPSGLVLDRSSTALCWPDKRGRCPLVVVFSVCLGMLVVGGFSVDVHVACDDRISLYPAAPFRLATLLHAWTIAQVGRGSSLARQTGWARSANPHNSHTSDPPNAPEGASELSMTYATGIVTG